MKITFIGHAGFLLEHDGVRLAVDPFITGNPLAKISLADLTDVNYVLVSHGHGDHLGDAVDIAKQSGATVVSVFEIANYCARHGVKAHGMHLGGSHNFGDVQIKLTLALHGSSIGGEKGPAEYLGNPCGFLINLGGKTIYHAGDTGLFGDMALIGSRNRIDVAMLPIGDNFTMGIDDAVEAAAMLKPAVCIPMHYDTFPLISQNPEEFKNKVEERTAAKAVILKPGESYQL